VTVEEQREKQEFADLVAVIEKMIKESEDRVFARMEAAMEFIEATNPDDTLKRERVRHVLKEVIKIARETS
jgi:hypothetical protein